MTEGNQIDALLKVATANEIGQWTQHF